MAYKLLILGYATAVAIAGLEWLHKWYHTQKLDISVRKPNIEMTIL